MADLPAASVAKVAKLLELAREYAGKLEELHAEIDALLGGAAGIGVAMKALEHTFDGAWGVRYAGGQTGRYVWRPTTDKPHVKRLIKLLGLAEVQRRVWVYLRNEDPFYVRARHPWLVFVGSINSHAEAGGASEVVPVTGCKHDPACKSDQQHTKKKLKELRT